jgi:UDP-GlcNAc:undecaprenyl-phosphate/decaprenyl-phosphate GlcNAc-1-phosphate transferase
MNLFVLSIAMFLISLISSFYITKKVRGIAIYYKAFAKINFRSSHKRITPNLGGITFYLIFILSLYFIHSFDSNNVIFAILPGCTILFYIGLKDDLMVLSPSTKLLAQILAAVFLVFHNSFVITHLFGVFNIYDVPIFLGYILSILTIVFIINAFNLIDGIDGLAGLISIAIFIPFGIIFYFSEIYFLYLLAIILIASIIAFLYFNFSKKKKIFMGDSGSLVIGFLIAAMFLRFFTMKEINKEMLNLSLSNTIITAISFIFIPFLDTIRVFTIRILNKKSPFHADKNHIHHLIIEKLGLNHIKTSFLLFGIQVVTSLLFYSLNYYLKTWSFILIFLLYLHLFLLFFWLLKKDKIIIQKV